MDHIAPLFIAGLSVALIGWVIMVITSRIERKRSPSSMRRAMFFAFHEVTSRAVTSK
jgi:hypothetical protein